MELIAELESEIAKVVGKKCRHADLNVGSTLMLDFGRELTYDPPIVNPNNGEIVKIGEFNFMFFCSWRIENKERIFCTWQDKTYHYDKLEIAVNMLTEKELVDYAIDYPSMDLVLRFNDGISLKVFCDLQTEDAGKSNYYFSNFNELFAVKNNSELIKKEQSVKRVFI